MNRIIIFLLSIFLVISGCKSEEETQNTSSAQQSCSNDNLEFVSDTSLPLSAQECVNDGVAAEGVLEVLAAINSDGSETLEYVLETETKMRYQLFFQGVSPELQSGTRLRVSGTHLLCGNAEQPVPLVVETYESLDAALGIQALPGTTGAQTTAVILVSFSDSSNTYTAADSQNVVFTKTSNYWYENSFNQTWITGQTFGPYTIAQSKVGCDTTTLANQAQAAASAAGVDLSPYKRRMFVFPKNGCSWLGLANVGGTTTKAWINASFGLHTVAHELGHNLGLYHANAHNCGSTTLGSSCSKIEYGDTTDSMGNYLAGHYNAFQKERLGWITAPTISTSGSYILDPYETATQAPKALKILKSSTSTSQTYYYLEYRQPIGFDSVLANSSTYNLTKGVIIHTGSTSSGNSSLLLNMNPSAGSWYKSALNVGQTFTDSAAGVSITLTSANGGGANLTVTVAGATTPEPCVRGTPSVTLAAAQTSALPAGSAAAYTVSVRNNDSATCAAQSFSLGVSKPSSSWNAAFVSAQFSDVLPGANTSTTLSVTSPLTASGGNYNFSVTATPITGTARTVAGSYTVAASNTLAVAIPLDNAVYSGGSDVLIPVDVRFNGQPASGASYMLEVISPKGTITQKSGVVASDAVTAHLFRVNSCTQAGSYLARVEAVYNGQTASNSRTFSVQ